MSNENEDKKVIGDEEREKMLNLENVEDNRKIEDIEKVDKEKDLDLVKEKAELEKESGVVKGGEVEKIKKELEDSQKEPSKPVRVPIGGIQLVGFFRSRSRDKNKENDGTTEEGVDLLETSGQKPDKNEGGLRATLARGFDSLAARNPFARKDNQEPVDVEAANDTQRPKLIARLSKPLASVLPKRFKRTDKEQKEGGGDDVDAKPSSPDDGMESVKLDTDGDAENAEKKGLADDTATIPIYLQWRDRILNLSRHEKILAAAIFFSIVFLIILIAAVSGSPMLVSPPVIDGKVITSTQCGPVEGMLENDVFVFYGIPYAVPPLGSKRWKPAQPLNRLELCWSSDVFKAEKTLNTRQCWREEGADKLNGFEDCLYLDIWTPEVRYINPMPVVVIIDTATFLGGPVEIFTPTPQVVRSREVIFVRPNFRLGVFGFLAATPLSPTVHPPSSGNYGLSDLIVALKWVQTNIGHFGGDPKKVTILGHRAGATLATVLSVSPAAKGLFKRAWATSGSAMFPGDVLQIAENKSEPFVDKLCKNDDDDEAKQKPLDCLLDQGPETVMAAMDNTWRSIVSDLPKKDEINATKHDWLVLDGKILKEHVWSALQDRHADLVIGTTAHSEASLALREQIDRAGTSHSDTIVQKVRESVLGEKNLADEAIHRYNSTWEGFVSMITDIRTVCPLLAMARSQPNITFYVATQPRNSSTLQGALADVNLDISAILGLYTANMEPHKSFVKTMQETFYNFVNDGVLPVLSVPASAQPVLTIGRNAEWHNEYPNCGFWVSNEFTPLYARRD